MLELVYRNGGTGRDSRLLPRGLRAPLQKSEHSFVDERAYWRIRSRAKREHLKKLKGLIPDGQGHRHSGQGRSEWIEKDMQK